MPIRVPVLLLVLGAGLTLGLVTVAVVARAPGGGDGPATVRAAADRSALAVLREWDRRRASAWADDDPAALASLYPRGSSAGAADVALLRRYAARGLVVRGIRMQVLRARVLVSRPRRIEIEVTDRLTAAVAVRIGDAASSRRLPDDAPSTRILELRQVDGRWLMVRVSGPRSAADR